MSKSRKMVDVAEDNTLEEVYQAYRFLKEESKAWQEERGEFWLTSLVPAQNPPYFTLADLPEGAIFELWGRLNRVLEKPVPEPTLRETWQSVRAGGTIPDFELLSTLQLTLSAIAQLARIGFASQLRDNPESLNCPVCGEPAILSVLIPPQGKRLLHCSFCGQEWPAMRTGCILCGNQEAALQNYLHTEEYPGVELVTCEACGQGFKEFDLRLLEAKDIVWEDIRTSPLNYAAERWLTEHGQSEIPN